MDNLQTQIDNLKTLQESYDVVAQAAEAYNVGKVQLAQAITSKGVETSPTESYPEMAEKVNAISQLTYEINGGEMYAKQLFGSLETPNYWNLYDILAQLLSNGRLVNYGGILLAEYYRGYDSLALSGAGAGGAYVVSDKDGNGNFIMYTEDTTHVWATEFDGKGNRWVAYCFADEYHDFQITDTNTSPRSIFIGRKVGVITSLVNGRCSQIVVPDGNELVDFRTGTFSQDYGKTVVFRGLLHHSSSYLIYRDSKIENIYIEAKKVSKSLVEGGGYGSMNNLKNFTLVSDEISGQIIEFGIIDSNYSHLTSVFIKCPNINSGINNVWHQRYDSLDTLFLIDVEKCNFYWKGTGNTLKCVIIEYLTNDKTLSVSLSNTCFNSVSDVNIKDGWCKNLNVSSCSSLTEANMYAHILQRLKHDEPDCGDGVTITLGSTNLAKLTSEESVQLLDDLTNIYGYTFA